MKRIFALLALLLSRIAFAQGIGWVNYSTANSQIGSDNVHAMVVDSMNNIWFGTGGGLSKFGGGSWTNYTTSNSPLPSNYVTSLSIAPDGVLWIGTSTALASFDGTIWRTFSLGTLGLPDSFVSAIKATYDGVWVGVMDWSTIINGGLAFYDGKSWDVYKKENSPLPDNRIEAIEVSHDSTVWIGTLAGLAEFNKSKWRVFQMDSSSGFTIMEDVEGIAVDSENTIWIASRAYPLLSGGIVEGGLLKLRDTTFTAFTRANSNFPSGANSVNSLFVDKFGNVWVALWYQDPGPGYYQPCGLVLGKFDGKSMWRFYQDHLISTYIQCITMDKKNHLWIGTQYGATEMIDSTLASIKHSSGANLPDGYSLSQNFPNPFNPTTMLTYRVPVLGHVILKVYDVLGRNVKTLVDERRTPGSYSVTFDASDLPSGVYFCRLQAGAFNETRKLTVLK